MEPSDVSNIYILGWNQGRWNVLTLANDPEDVRAVCGQGNGWDEELEQWRLCQSLKAESVWMQSSLGILSQCQSLKDSCLHTLTRESTPDHRVSEQLRAPGVALTVFRRGARGAAAKGCQGESCQDRSRLDPAGWLTSGRARSEPGAAGAAPRLGQHLPYLGQDIPLDLSCHSAREALQGPV